MAGVYKRFGKKGRARLVNRLRRKRFFPRAAVKGRITVSEKFASETTPVIRGNNGYAMSTSINEMPQYGLYKQLYRKFRVRSITYILVPQYNSADFLLIP